MAEWSKALDLGSSLSGGVGSNPTAANLYLFSLGHRVFATWSLMTVSQVHWWYSGEHSCLPSSWPGFDSRPMHSVKFSLLVKQLSCLALNLVLHLVAPMYQGKGIGKDISKVAWPSGLRRWIKAPVSQEAWVQIPPLPIYICFR